MTTTRRRLSIIRAMLTTLVLAYPLFGQAQSVDFTGEWEMQTAVLLPNEKEPCSFSGMAKVQQTKNFLSGYATLQLVSGPAACPAEMMAELSGNVDGAAIYDGMLYGGKLFGEAMFSGRVMYPGIGSAAAEAESFPVVGGFEVTVGPYVGLKGDWDAMVSNTIFEDGFEAIAMLSGSSALLLLGTGAVAGRRSRSRNRAGG